PGARKPRYITDCPPRRDGGPMSERDARDLARDLQRAYDAGKWDPWAAAVTTPAPTGAAPPPDAPRTVLAPTREWIKSQTYGGAKEDARRIELYLAPTPLGALPLAAATPRDIAAFVARVRVLPSAAGGTLAPRT